jgi:hypothetical protein
MFAVFAMVSAVSAVSAMSALFRHSSASREGERENDRKEDFHSTKVLRGCPLVCVYPTMRLVPSPMGRSSNREECSLRFETPDNTGNEQRGVPGSALLEEEYVFRCISARAITEAS